MMKHHSSYITSDILSNKSPTIHGFSKRILGDMRLAEKQKAFLDVLGIHTQLFLVKQIHGDVVADPEDGNSEADAIVSGNKHGMAIGILTADCVPIILSDTRGAAIGVIHAGWKGTVNQIIIKTVNRMCDVGAKREEIVASIGPRIGACCYSVPEDRAKIFQSSFGDDPRICYSNLGTWYLDLGYVTMQLLMRAGITSDRIDANPMCTSCQTGSFYSYRKDSKETFGEQMAVICRK